MTQRILIADDEAHIRVLMEQTLEDLEDQGVKLLIASNGAEALEMIQAELPELAFLDVMMPKMNGFEVCAAVKSDPKLQNVFVVILTAKGQEFDIKQGKEVGADLYLTKPFDPDLIYQRAVDVLKGAAIAQKSFA
jgi:two-component system, OmpR family, alkaline phosphatase synthesis response regulator PhoP